MASLSTCHLGLWLGWQILLNLELRNVNTGSFVISPLPGGIFNVRIMYNPSPRDPGQAYTMSSPRDPGQAYTMSSPRDPGQAYTMSSPRDPGQAYTMSSPRDPGQAYTMSSPRDHGQAYTMSALYMRNGQRYEETYSTVTTYFIA